MEMSLGLLEELKTEKAFQLGYIVLSVVLKARGFTPTTKLFLLVRVTQPKKLDGIKG
jgi:hypothetical protein